MSDLDRVLERLADLVAQRVVDLQKAEAEKNATVYLSPQEMASRMGVTERTLANRRHRKLGPKYTKVEGRVRYVVTETQPEH